jgi:hypothetical protein
MVSRRTLTKTRVGSVVAAPAIGAHAVADERADGDHALRTSTS